MAEGHCTVAASGTASFFLDPSDRQKARFRSGVTLFGVGIGVTDARDGDEVSMIHALTARRGYRVRKEGLTFRHGAKLNPLARDPQAVELFLERGRPQGLAPSPVRLAPRA